MKNLMFLILSLLFLNVTHGQINLSKQKLTPSKKVDAEIKPYEEKNDLFFSQTELDKIQKLSLEEFQLIKDMYVDGAKPLYLRATICSTKGNRVCASVNWDNWTCKKLSFYMEKRGLFPGYEIDSCKDTPNGIVATLSRLPSTIDDRQTNKKN